MKEFVVYFVGCVLLEVFCGMLIPEGKIKGFVMSTVSVIIFYYIISFISKQFLLV